MPLSARMAHALKGGPMTFAALAEQLDAKLDSIIKAGNRGKVFTRVSGGDGITRLALVERRVG